MHFPLFPTNAHLVWHFRGKTAILCSSKVHPTSGVVALGTGDRSWLAANALVGAHRQQEKPSAWKLL